MVGVAVATPTLHVNAAAEAPRPLWYTRRVPAASRVPQAATTVSAVVKAVPAIPLSASKVNTCSAHRETVDTAQGRSALRTTLPFALAIVGFLIVWASFVSWKVASLVLILYSPLKDATPLTTWPIATALPTIALPRPTATHMPVAAGAPAYVAVSLVVVPDFENVTSSPPTVWHVAAPAPKKRRSRTIGSSAGRAQHRHLQGKWRLRRARSRPVRALEASSSQIEILKWLSRLQYGRAAKEQGRKFRPASALDAWQQAAFAV